jgi:hypothetical protein
MLAPGVAGKRIQTLRRLVAPYNVTRD